MRGKCPECGKTGKFSNPTHKQAKCTKCGHRGNSDNFKDN